MKKSEQSFNVEEEVKDKISVFIRKAGGKHKPFLVRLTPIWLNGTSVSIFGRPTKHASDNRVEVEQIIFRNLSDIEKIANVSARKDVAPHVHESLIKRILAHPSVCVEPDRFSK